MLCVAGERERERETERAGGGKGGLLPGASKCPHARSNSNLSPCPDKSEAVMRLGKRNRDLFLFRVFFQPATAVLVVLLWGGSGFERGILLSSPEPPPKESPKSWQKRKSVTPEGGDGFDVAGRGENFETSA
jgi:hypothetical protein